MQLTQDLNLLARENQNLNNEFVKIAQDKEAYKNLCDSFGSKDKDLSQALRQTQMERDDILRYRRT